LPMTVKRARGRGADELKARTPAARAAEVVVRRKADIFLVVCLLALVLGFLYFIFVD